MAIRMYNTDHTGPNKKDGGAHVGFMSCAYQEYVEFIGTV
jgi:hypothetical protein